MTRCKTQDDTEIITSARAAQSCVRSIAHPLKDTPGTTPGKLRTELRPRKLIKLN